jgi:hypothetical protein
MSGSYQAWNGRPYPWPPPEDWYQADDGRWWPAGHGPGPRTVAPPDPIPADAPLRRSVSHTSATEQLTALLGGRREDDRPAPSPAGTARGQVGPMPAPPPAPASPTVRARPRPTGDGDRVWQARLDRARFRRGALLAVLCTTMTAGAAFGLVVDRLVAG